MGGEEAGITDSILPILAHSTSNMNYIFITFSLTSTRQNHSSLGSVHFKKVLFQVVQSSGQGKTPEMFSPSLINHIYMINNNLKIIYASQSGLEPLSIGVQSLTY